MTQDNEANYYPAASDEELSRLSSAGDGRAFEVLLSRYMGLIASSAAAFRRSLPFSDDVEIADFWQEGSLGLLMACRSYDPSKGVGFKNYAMSCVKNRFKDMAKPLLKKGAVPANSILSLEDGMPSVADSMEDSPDETLERKEYIRSRHEEIREKLSDFEFKVAALYLSGYSYRECAEKLSVDEKKVDNALTRIRKKLSR